MPIRFLRLSDVMKRTALSRSSIYLRRSQGLFPEPIPLGGRAVGWLESDIEDWANQQIKLYKQRKKNANEVAVTN
ncbi:MAG: AlpA family transcriptional regulator [Gammaproteobacteria bacterium]|nr:AlpA family transcriptional regulator [Gammaproteobacteria bacterium]